MATTNHHINRAIYFQVKDLMRLSQPEQFRERFELIRAQYNPDKVYLEVYRHGQTLEASMFESFANFFRQEGLSVAAGLTTDEPENNAGGFDTLCYTDPESKKILKQATMTAAPFADELLIDDFFFTNCRCPRCIASKGEQSWAEFRTRLMSEMLEEVILPAAKKSNPSVQIILKLPNWYQDYNRLGYSANLAQNQALKLYVGAETRNPVYTQQHLPKYLSYFITRYIKKLDSNIAGTWIDPYEITGNWTWFAEQIEFTLLAKTPEITLFSLGDLIQPQYKLAFPIAGETIRSMDSYLPTLGMPTGLACYMPEGATGEDYLHGYIASLGIPLEPKTTWPETDSLVLLTESSAGDPAILDRIHSKLMLGHDVILTSGFLAAVQGEAFSRRFAPIRVEAQTITSQRFAYSVDGGVTFAGVCDSSQRFTFPKISYGTNDTWEILAILGEESSAPLLLKLEYGLGNLYIWTMPHDFGMLPLLPTKVQNPLRLVCTTKDAPVVLRGPGRVLLFTYDNDCIVLHSLLPWFDRVTLELRHGYIAVENLETGEITESEPVGGIREVQLSLRPGVSYVFKMVNGKR